MNRQRILNPNKKYKELKQKQKAKISGFMYQETSRYLEENQRMPVSEQECEVVVQRVYDRISGLGFWIPYEEVYQQYRKKRLHYEKRLEEKGLPEHLLEKKTTVSEDKKSLAVKSRKKSKKRKQKTEKISSVEQDNRFFFIAGYTSGGAPYGVTWEEMGLTPWEELS